MTNYQEEIELVRWLECVKICKLNVTHFVLNELEPKKSLFELYDLVDEIVNLCEKFEEIVSDELDSL